MAIVIPVPDDVASAIEELRQQMFRSLGRDQSADSWPHITLKLSFDAPGVMPIADLITELAGDTPPIEVSVRNLGFFDEGDIFVDIEPNPQLEELRQRLLAELSQRHGVDRYPIEDERFHFHITLVHSLTRAELESTWNAFSATDIHRTFTVRHLDVFRYEDHRWTTAERSMLLGERGVVRASGNRHRLDHLVHRRQFLLSTDPRHVIIDGRQAVIADHFLSVHPDLGLTQVQRDGRSLTLLGFALDPHHPGDGDEQILSRLIDEFRSEDRLFASIDALGGRWVLIANDGADTLVLHDATGQRQVYYSRDTDAGVVCASEPGLLAEHLRLRNDPEAVDFVRSRPIDDYEVYWMPGDTTLFTEVAALLPNHFLRVADRTSHRFWPVEPLPPAEYAPALAECLSLLRGQINSAARRFPFAVPMTAGWDSRMMLALCRDHRADLYTFTLAYPNMPAESTDVVVPARLLGRLGIDHHVIEYPAAIDLDFKAVFRRNNPSVNYAYCPDSQALHATYPADHVCVTGDAAEVVKCYYQRTRPASEPVSALELVELNRLGDHHFVERAFGRWLAEAGDPPVDLLDLFCWEQMAGRWQSKIRGEYDTVQESFAPLNNRRLLRLMLAIDTDRRRAPDYTLFADLIRTLWPETLSEPINPPEPISRAHRLATALRLTRVARLLPGGVQTKVKRILR